MNTTEQKKEFFIEWSRTPTLYKKVVKEVFETREDVLARHHELTGTYVHGIETYIHAWQAGLPMTDNETFYHH